VPRGVKQRTRQREVEVRAARMSYQLEAAAILHRWEQREISLLRDLISMRSRRPRGVIAWSPYYWNAGYWYPAWGYAPNAYYAWDGPVYAYNNLPPDQVIANVQATLQQQGYYHGEVDGLIGPLTRSAIADYQRDHGLYTTSAIDQPTLQSLGMAIATRGQLQKSRCCILESGFLYRKQLSARHHSILVSVLPS
jgi:Putative peptidoglycan binding domain